MNRKSKKRKLEAQDIYQAVQNGDVERIIALIAIDANAVNETNEVMMRHVSKHILMSLW